MASSRSPGYWQLLFHLDVSRRFPWPPPLWIYLLKQLTELRETLTFTSLLYNKRYDKEDRYTANWRATSRWSERVMSTRVSVPVELGVHHPPSSTWMCSQTWEFLEHYTVGICMVQFSSVAQLCPTLCNPMNHNTPDLLSITNSRSLTKPSQVQPGPDVVEKMAEVLGSISHSWVVYLCDLTFLASVSYKCMSSMRWAIFIMGFPGTLVVKNLPANAGDIRDVGSIPGREDPLEEGMATHSSILAWRILWTEEPGRLQSIESQNWTWLKQLSTHMYLYSIFHL